MKLNAILFVVILSLCVPAAAASTTSDRHVVNQELNRLFLTYPQTNGWVYGTVNGEACSFGFSLADHDQAGIPAGFHANMGTEKNSFGNIDLLEQDSPKYYQLKAVSMTDTEIKGTYQSYESNSVPVYMLTSFKVHHIDSNTVSVTIASHTSFFTYPVFTGAGSTCIFKK